MISHAVGGRFPVRFVGKARAIDAGRMTELGVIEDDARIVEITARKRYAQSDAQAGAMLALRWKTLSGS